MRKYDQSDSTNMGFASSHGGRIRILRRIYIENARHWCEGSQTIAADFGWEEASRHSTIGWQRVSEVLASSSERSLDDASTSETLCHPIVLCLLASSHPKSAAIV